MPSDELIWHIQLAAALGFPFPQPWHWAPPAECLKRFSGVVVGEKAEQASLRGETKQPWFMVAAALNNDDSFEHDASFWWVH